MIRHNQKFILYLSLSIIILFSVYQNFLIKSKQRILQTINVQKKNVTFKKVSIAHYTTLYGIRTDSNTKIFNENLNQICHILNPDDYLLADSIFVSLVDLIRLPYEYSSYRLLNPSQLWIVHSEESPRNSYKTVEMKDITELDNWFNLTSTLKPESDFHVQYRVKISCCFFLYKLLLNANLGISY